MKLAVTAFLLLAFFASATVSVFAMGQMDEHGKCLAEVVQGKECPAQSGTLSYASFHLTSFKGFSTAVFALILLLAAAVLASTRSREPHALRFLWFSRNLFSHFVSPLKQQITRWLSLRQLSPAR
ncbi:MAG: hypothetical protein A2842_01780 [Candidatus Wildermuthbacteria bacterium RIFCSPHIGHO2_01_FULL_48_25]|uniref:Transmembrane protein n=1 Tax=Candidatus Wildermuthbacteria bacterium RIFCSPLOWO2_01_FULL_48_16 TaxID=1802461 RepID=A0A1G2RJN9_9BACT|nr:MAG: hypothetical protein A2842_01780 [Candidatus Wildermuthbacteria bacterium RIFCSPHIGHO2_01_FULL_48_25]OHA68497.1 MAG: hypothetical protein A3J57_02305 [Candidatus Wildermuthbacteria bacterium RIFCSPHIGHO2_02_FULL_49_12b]OHA72738.1 MAG: hypothetical protein A3B24_00680 [Candidatus Wildermuthbacteria bacterium RIFCSPLOWO2_01_FULL_48_16]